MLLPGTEDHACRFACILADPPWPEHGGGQIKRGADRHYPLMPVRDIAALPVRAVAAHSAHLWLWVTNNYLAAGLQVMEAWGFRYVTNRVWVKDRPGLGQYLRMQHELLLLGVRGDAMVPEPPNRVPSVLHAPRTRHSAKPLSVYDDIEKASPGPRLELFTRVRRDGWTPAGNEVTGEDVRETLARLATGDDLPW